MASRRQGLDDDPVSNDAPAFRLWPPVALGLPWVVGYVLTFLFGDPVALDRTWVRVLGILLVLAFCVWNGWALWLMHKHRTALLPGGSSRVVIDSGPFAVSRNPLYVGLIALYVGLALLVSFWALVLVPVGVALLWWGAVRPEEQYLSATFGAEYDDYRRRVRRWL
jgi:protein-S-isoprenylcysteine O-methyltransferase Ste14